MEDILKTLDTSKAMGPDLINARILKEASRELSIPLCMLFNTSLQSNIFPSQWKIANVVPVFKKNDPQKVNNYRPISLLCIISKVFENAFTNISTISFLTTIYYLPINLASVKVTLQ